MAEVWPPGGMVAASVGTVAELASAAFCNGPLGFSAKCAMPLTPPPTTPPPMAPIAPPKAVSCNASGSSDLVSGKLFYRVLDEFFRALDRRALHQPLAHRAPQGFRPSLS